jgi:hypothetical protein
MTTFKNYINGEWLASRSGKTFKNINPANTEEIVVPADVWALSMLQSVLPPLECLTIWSLALWPEETMLSERPLSLPRMIPDRPGLT